MTQSSRINIDQHKSDAPKLSIGLVVNSALSSASISALVAWCQQQENLGISHLLVSNEILKHQYSLSAKCFTWMTKLEALLIRKPSLSAPTAKQNLSLLVPQTGVLDSAKTGWREIEALQLDLLLIADSGALPESLGQLAKFGALQIDYGLSGPVGFWPVYFKQDYTPFSISQLNQSGEPNTPLIAGQIATQYCYLLNNKRIEQKCLHYTKHILSRIACDQKIPEPAHVLPISQSLHAMPSLLVQASYIFRLGSRLIRRAIRSAFRLDFTWSVAYLKSGWSTADMASALKIPRPDKHFLADPFVVNEGGRDYCFLEDYDFGTQKGHVAVYQLHAESAECLGNALVEPFHLSFPYMFRYKSELYMCPETSRNRQIRVYKCVSFPLQWQLHTVLMDNVSAADTMLFEHGDRWWMLTNMDVTETGDYCTELSIFWANSPLSNHWHAHPANPVFIDAAKGRNAGLLFDEDHIYRVAQTQGFEQYGKAFTINRIDVLNENDYKETEVRAVQANFFPNLNGTHHMHSNGEVTVFDFI